MDYTDLHSHSIYSDGTNTVKELIDLCVENNIKYYSLTDHDNVYGLKEARELCQKHNINFINGIEFTADYHGEEIHVLAYGFSEDNETLQYIIKKSKELRQNRNKIMLQKFKDFGIDIDINRLNLDENSVITRADIAAELIRLGHASDKNDAFNKYLSKGCATFVKKEAIDFKEILSAIKKMGAFSSLAHPNIYDFYKNNFKNSVSELKKHGLDAIECYHSSYDNFTTNTLLGYCNRYDLLKSGGSDYHGTKKKEVFLGKTTSGQYLPFDNVKELLNLI